MSRANLIDFVDFVKLPANISLKAELDAIPTKEEFLERCVNMVQENNYEFTKQELLDWLDEIEKEKQEETDNPYETITYPIKDMPPSYVVIFF